MSPVRANCTTCEAERRFLLRKRRPGYEAGVAALRIADIFCGCGGMTLGLAEAARALGLATDVRLAVDDNPTAAAVYARNFPSARVLVTAVRELFDGALGKPPTKKERALRRRVGPIDIVLAGPPCQGHSDLNNHTRRDDPRNKLYAYAARAVEILRPAIAIFENVPTVRHDMHQAAKLALSGLATGGYTIAEAVVDLRSCGVPQSRQRHIAIGVKRGIKVDPTEILSVADTPSCGDLPRDVRWAIGDLAGVKSDQDLDRPSAHTSDNAERIAWLFDNGEYDLPNRLRPMCHQSEHSYRSMYGRLRWDAPAQTITTGFTSMGQGRYVHPQERRTLTPHEAARLQTFPDFYDFTDAGKKTALSRLIGNAVPPLLGVRLGANIIPQAMRHSRGALQSPASPSPETRRRMRATRQAGTNAELKFREALDTAGLRYEVNVRPLEGCRSEADIVFRKQRVAMFINGCFWHGCPSHGTWPKANAAWWRSKIFANRRRDAAIDADLRRAGWRVIRAWEHDDPAIIAAKAAAMIQRKSLSSV